MQRDQAGQKMQLPGGALIGLASSEIYRKESLKMFHGLLISRASEYRREWGFETKNTSVTGGITRVFRNAYADTICYPSSIVMSAIPWPTDHAQTRYTLVGAQELEDTLLSRVKESCQPNMN